MLALAAYPEDVAEMLVPETLCLGISPSEGGRPFDLFRSQRTVSVADAEGGWASHKIVNIYLQAVVATVSKLAMRGEGTGLARGPGF